MFKKLQKKSLRRKLMISVVGLAVVSQSVLVVTPQVSADEFDDITGDIIQEADKGITNSACRGGAENSTFCKDAQNVTDGVCGFNGSSDCWYMRLARTILGGAIAIAALLSVWYFITGVIKYAAGGNGKPESIAAARKTIIFAVAGLILALSSGFILSLIVGG